MTERKLTGKGGGSGRYISKYAQYGRRNVEVAHFPEDIGTLRIVLREVDVESSFNIKMDEIHAHLLWVCLDEFAKEYGWSKEITT